MTGISILLVFPTSAESIHYFLFAAFFAALCVWEGRGVKYRRTGEGGEDELQTKMLAGDSAFL